MENLEQIKSFPITVYGELTPFSDVISKARCRIFYKGANRNGTYITDEFANKLLSTIAYAPIKGVYDKDDYTDHGYSRSLGRIYGVVPENANISWEKHMDSDGVEREYACVDVYLYTAIYAEAASIVGKSQSMELWEKSIQGEWVTIDGKKYYQFTDACFLGLQVLGDKVEPCFEGAAFFSLYESLTNMVKKIEAYNYNLEANKQGGQGTMPVINFKMSDKAKCEALWSLLNENYTEEGNWTVDYSICEVYDDYVLVYKYSDGTYERVYYTKDDATDSVTINARQRCHVLDVTDEELNALNTIRALNGGTYEKIDEVFSAKNDEIEKYSTEKAELEQKIVEYTETVSTLETEKNEIQTQYEAANELLNETKTTLENAQVTLASLQSECDSLAEYKKGIELSEKNAVIASYSEMLSDEVLDNFTEHIDNYSALELDKELAYALKNANPSVFSKNQKDVQIPKDFTSKSSLEEILSKYQG